MPRLAFVTCRNLPEPDPDEALLLAAAQEAGLQPELAAWDDEEVEWGAYDLAIVRSTWDYYAHEQKFRAWIKSTDRLTRLLNPAGLMLRTIDKRYILGLHEVGIPGVPTKIVAPKHESTLHDILEQTGWGRVVLKPAVSASSSLTRLFDSRDAEDALAFLREIHRRGHAMVQPYLASVETGGEVALVLIDGKFTHAVVKHPRFHSDDESVSPAEKPTAEQLGVALKALNYYPEASLYGRIDLMRMDDGCWVLSEAEFIEPSLFFREHPPALDRFIGALVRLVDGA